MSCLREPVVCPTFNIFWCVLLLLATTPTWDTLLPISLVAQAQLVVRHPNSFGFKLGGRSDPMKALSLRNIVRPEPHDSENDFLQCETPSLNIPRGNVATVMEGGTLELRCSLTREFGRFGADGIYWEHVPSEIPLPRKLSQDTDSRVEITQSGLSSTLYVHNVREEDSGTYHCLHKTALQDLKLPYVCARSMAVGGPPAKYVNLTCEALGNDNFTCQWERGDDYIAGDAKTKYEFQWTSLILPAGGNCSVWRSDDARHWGCLKGINQDIDKHSGAVNFHRHHSMTFLITGSNAFGKQNWSIPEDHRGSGILSRHYVRPLPPSNPRAVALNTSAMFVSWPGKEDYGYNGLFIFYQLQMRSEYDLVDSSFYPYKNIIDYGDDSLGGDSLMPSTTFTTNHPVTPPQYELTITKDRIGYVTDIPDDGMPAIMSVGADEKWVTVSDDPSVNLLTAKNITIAGLLPYTLYEFRLRSHPIIDGYWSQFSGVFSNRTEASEPQGSIVPIPGAFDVVSRNVTHLSMTVYWTSLAPWHRNGPDFRYEVSFMPAKRPHHVLGSVPPGNLLSPSTHQVASPVTSLVRTEQVYGPNFTFAYELGQRYHLVVRPINRVGESAASTTITVEKNEGLQVTRITVVKLPTAPNVYTVTIRWMVTGTAAAAAARSSKAVSNNSAAATIGGGGDGGGGRTKRQVVHSNGLEEVPGEKSSTANGRDLYNVINATVYYCLAHADPTPASTEHLCTSHLMSKVISLSLLNQRERKVQTLLQLKTGNNLKYQFAVGVSAVAGSGANMSPSASSSAVVHSGLKWATCLILSDRQMPEFDFVDHVATENATLQITWRLKCEDRGELIEGYKIYVILCPPEQTIDKPSYCAQVLGTSLSSLPQTEVVIEHGPPAGPARAGNSSSAAADTAAVVAAPGGMKPVQPAPQHFPSSPHFAAVITEEESLNYNYASLNNSFAVLLKINDRTSFAVKGLLPLRKYVVAVATVNPDGTESEPRLGKLIVETTERLWPKDPTHDNTIMILGIMLGLFFAFLIVTCACCWKRFQKMYREAQTEFRNIKLPEESLMQMSLLASSARAAAAAAVAANNAEGGAAGKRSIVNDNYYAQIAGGDATTGGGYIDAQRLANGGGIGPAAGTFLSRQLSTPLNGYGPAGVERMYITKFEDPEETEEEEEEKISTEEEQKQLSEDSNEQQGDGEKEELIIRRAVSCAVPAHANEDDEDEGISMTVLLTRSKSSNGGGVDKNGDAAVSERIVKLKTPIGRGAAAEGGGVRAHSAAYSPLTVGETTVIADGSASKQLPTRLLGRRLCSFGARAAATFLGGGSSNALAASDNRKTSESSTLKAPAVSSLAARSEPKLGETLALEPLKTAAAAAGATTSAADVNNGHGKTVTERSCVVWSVDGDVADGAPLLPKTSGTADGLVVQQAVVYSDGVKPPPDTEQPTAVEKRRRSPALIINDEQQPGSASADTSRDPQSKVIGWLATSRAGKKKRKDADETGNVHDDDIELDDDIGSSQSTIRDVANSDAPAQQPLAKRDSDAYQDAQQLLAGHKQNMSNGAEFSGGASLEECYLATRGLSAPAVVIEESIEKSDKLKKKRKKKSSASSQPKSSSTASTANSWPENGSNANLTPNVDAMLRNARSATPTRPPALTTSTAGDNSSVVPRLLVNRISPKPLSVLVINAANNDVNELSSAPLISPQTASSAAMPLLHHQDVSTTSVETDENNDSNANKSSSLSDLQQQNVLPSSYVQMPLVITTTPLSSSKLPPPLSRSPVLSSPVGGTSASSIAVVQPNFMPAAKMRQDENAYVLQNDDARAVSVESDDGYVLRSDAHNNGVQATFPVLPNDNSGFEEAENGYVLEPRRGR